MKQTESKSEWLCKNCGHCCRHFTIDAKNKEQILEAFNKETGIKIKKAEKVEVHIFGDCVHLIGAKCVRYNTRPKLCRTHYCKRYPLKIGGLYQKLCKVCWKLRTFQSGTERDKQGICGNCWVW